jgi:multidrug efflux pump
MVISATSDFPEIYKYMEDIKAKARASGIFIVVDSDLNYNSPVVKVTIDRSKASDMGISMQAIGDTMALMVGGNYINRFNLNGRSYEVIPQVPRDQRLTADRLAQYYVRTSNGDLVPLSTVVSIGSGIDPNALTHFNQLNSATFSAVPMPGVTQGQAVAFLNQTADEVLPASYHRDFLSTSRQFVKEGHQLEITLVFAIIVIYLVLAAQFESLRDPLVILISVPLAICGALIPLYFGVQTLNIYTQVGLVTLVGLISKHGILMTEFANQLQRNQNMSKREAIVHAAAVRLRPILMTTAAMVVGLIPLLIASGAGAASRFSIGIVIVSGMAIGTLFTLFVLPTFYSLIATDHRMVTRQQRNEEIAAIS